MGYTPKALDCASSFEFWLDQSDMKVHQYKPDTIQLNPPTSFVKVKVKPSKKNLILYCPNLQIIK